MRNFKLCAAAVIIMCISSGLAYAQQEAIFNKDYKPLVSNQNTPRQSVLSETRFFVFKNSQPAKKSPSFWSWLNFKSSPRENSDEGKVIIRQQWRDTIGFDVFIPYFKVKQAEEIVKEKASMNFFNMKGKPEFNEESKKFEYIFKRKF